MEHGRSIVMKSRTRFLCFVSVLFILPILIVYWNKHWSLVNERTLVSHGHDWSLSGAGPVRLPTNRRRSGSSLQINLSSGNDILVYIHIQKTGGSHFLSHLVSATNGSRPLCYKPNPELKRKLKKKRDIVFCPISPSVGVIDQVPEMWLVSEKTYGWVCGLHAFLMEMKQCVGPFLQHTHGDKQRNFHYISLVRHPVVRYISEFLHVQRGATWSYSHVCGGIALGEAVKKPCYPGYYKGMMWSNVTLDNFMSCSSNWANNRQTLMLADLESVDCLADTTIKRDELEKRLLESAKSNLEKLEFFGVSEYMVESGELFKHHFSVGLANPPKQKKLPFLHSSPLLYRVWKDTHLYRQIVHINRLDMELYHFALELFDRRLQQLNITIDHNRLDKEVYGLQDTIGRAF